MTSNFWRKEIRDFHWYIMSGDRMVACVDRVSDYVVDAIIAAHNKEMEAANGSMV